MRISLHHIALVISRRDRSDIQHAGLHGIRLVVRRNSLRPSDDTNLQDALSGLVDAIDETLERNAVGGRRRNEDGRLQHHFVGPSRRRPACDQPRSDNKRKSNAKRRATTDNEMIGDDMHVRLPD